MSLPNLPSPRFKQRGVALFATLIALVVLLIAAAALVRSTDTAQLISGNLAVKRDLTNQAETAVVAALANFSSTGTLATEASRWSDNSSASYYATAQASTNGIPTVLLTKSTTGETAITNGITYSYVVDRMCKSTGSADSQHCIVGSVVVDTGGNARNPTLNGGTGTPGADTPVVYRITVRVTDVRQTQSFVQTTFRSYGT